MALIHNSRGAHREDTMTRNDQRPRLLPVPRCHLWRRRAGAIAIVLLLGLAAGPPLLLQSDEALAGGAEPTCGDSVDLPWRCVVVQANEVGLIGELMDGACFVPETISFAPWRIDQGTGRVLEYVFTGKQDPFPCVFE